MAPTAHPDPKRFMYPLPEGTHLIHIGPQKTGSTALQWGMHLTRKALREYGVMYPGPEPRPREAAEVGLGFQRLGGDPEPRRMKAWHRLLEQVHDPAYSRVCVSLEAFARASDEQIERTIAELGGDQPHVVAVARRYDSLMPSQWQQRVKAQLRLPYEEWLRLVLGQSDVENAHWRNLWVPHDTVSLVQRWTHVVGSDNFTLIIADENDRALLPRTFEAMLGVPEGTLDMEGGRRNYSLSYSAVEVLRQLNIVYMDKGWPKRDYYELIRHGVIPALAGSPPAPHDTAIPPMPHWARQHLAELSDRRIEGLRHLPIHIVGDLENLRVPASQAPEETGPVDHRVPIATAVLALEGMMRGAVVSRQRYLRKHRRHLRKADRMGRGSAPVSRRIRAAVRAVRTRPRKR